MSGSFQGCRLLLEVRVDATSWRKVAQGSRAEKGLRRMKGATGQKEGRRACGNGAGAASVLARKAAFLYTHFNFKYLLIYLFFYVCLCKYIPHMYDCPQRPEGIMNPGPRVIGSYEQSNKDSGNQIQVLWRHSNHCQPMGHLSVTLLIYCTCVCMSCCVHVWRSEDSLEESVLCVHRVGPGSQPQVLQISSKCLYPLSHLSF